MSIATRKRLKFASWALAGCVACGGSERGAPQNNAVPDGAVAQDSGSLGQDGGLSYAVVPGWPALEPDTVTGQVSGLAMVGGELVVFHRADRPWFGEATSSIIKAPTLFWLRAERGDLRGKAGAGKFNIPHGLRRAPNGNLWVTDVGTHQVHELSVEGKLLRTFGTGIAGSDHKTFNGPTDVYVAPNGAIYVADGYGNHRVVKLSADGEYELEWGAAGSGPGQFDTPHAITADQAGRIYVADRGNARIQRFDSDGNFLDAWQSTELGRPWALTIAADGFVYCVDGGDQVTDPPDRAGIVKLDQDGSILARWSVYGNAAGELNWPHAIAVGEDGSVYVGEVRGGSRVQKFVPR